MITFTKKKFGRLSVRSVISVVDKNVSSFLSTTEITERTERREGILLTDRKGDHSPR